MKLLVKDMTCGHCASVITEAIKNLDKAAHINIDLNSKVVDIDTKKLDDDEIIDAIADEGYEPQLIEV